ncbi:MAG: hypothetical protein AUJ07_10380 [Crenarchaeota archaeon 13_1_40CM_3_53_5]|nr:MAG: hypothetical protein AUJ07_10380 [Crenarchaeota archaeon 13_1_40CM_3_53_5]
MGSGMARNLLKGGYEVIVHNRSPDKAADMKRFGAIVALSPEEVARQAEIVVLSLPNSETVATVVLGKRGLAEGLRKGSVVIDTSTIDPTVAIEIAGELKARGSYFLDSPVSGGPEGAKAGTLTIMVGGDALAYERSKHVLQKMGKSIFYLGESGAGQKMKLANQSLVGVYFVAIAETYRLATGIGVKGEDLLRVISTSWGDSPVFRHFMKVVKSGNYEDGASIKLMVKDLSIVRGISEKEEIPMSLAKLSLAHFRKASDGGHADLDMSYISRVLEG